MADLLMVNDESFVDPQYGTADGEFENQATPFQTVDQAVMVTPTDSTINLRVGTGAALSEDMLISGVTYLGVIGAESGFTVGGPLTIDVPLRFDTVTLTGSDIALDVLTVGDEDVWFTDCVLTLLTIDVTGTGRVRLRNCTLVNVSLQGDAFKSIFVDRSTVTLDATDITLRQTTFRHCRFTTGGPSVRFNLCDVNHCSFVGTTQITGDSSRFNYSTILNLSYGAFPEDQLVSCQFNGCHIETMTAVGFSSPIFSSSSFRNGSIGSVSITGDSDMVPFALQSSFTNTQFVAIYVDGPLQSVFAGVGQPEPSLSVVTNVNISTDVRFIDTPTPKLFDLCDVSHFSVDEVTRTSGTTTSGSMISDSILSHINMRRVWGQALVANSDTSLFESSMISHMKSNELIAPGGSPAIADGGLDGGTVFSECSAVHFCDINTVSSGRGGRDGGVGGDSGDIFFSCVVSHLWVRSATIGDVDNGLSAQGKLGSFAHNSDLSHSVIGTVDSGDNTGFGGTVAGTLAQQTGPNTMNIFNVKVAEVEMAISSVQANVFVQADSEGIALNHFTLDSMNPNDPGTVWTMNYTLVENTLPAATITNYNDTL